MSKSMKEIARRVGVSHVTVSRAINNPEKVHTATRLKIKAVCQELGFTPRVIPNRMRMVCLIIPSGDEFYPGDSVLINRIVCRLNEQHYHVITTSLSTIETLPHVFKQYFIAILHKSHPKYLPIIRDYASKVPFIAINDMNEDIGTAAILVGSDHRQGMTIALNYLLERKHKKIGYVGESIELKGLEERFNRYQSIMKEKGFYNESYVFINSSDMLIEGLRRLIREGVTAILVTESHLTSKVCYYLKMLGKEIPQDISVLASQLLGNETFYPPLTCISQPGQKVADLAVDLILAQATDNTTKLEHTYLIPYELIEHESVRFLQE